MKPLQIIAGIVAGAVGATIWAAIAYYAHLEVGYVAWGIGILVGVAVAATGENGTLPGVAAVLITIAALLAGKLGAVEIEVQAMQSDFATEIDAAGQEITDENLHAYLANTIAEDREEAGQEINWPEVDEEASVEESYPADIWKQAGRQLAKKTDAEKDTMREEQKQRIAAFADEFRTEYANAVREEGFMASFSPFDLLFFGLAIVTAWGIASRDE